MTTLAMLEDFIRMITAHLKKGERVKTGASSFIYASQESAALAPAENQAREGRVQRAYPQPIGPLRSPQQSTISKSERALAGPIEK
ncbi:MAG: hypothetical protein WCF39_16505 [Pseudolabrys sp.]|jgi:hypothetical protein